MNERKTAERIARALMLAGGGLSVVAVAVWGLDFLPQMPDWMIKLAVYKLSLGSGVALIIAGAALRKALRETTPRHPPPSELGAPAVPPLDVRQREPEGVEPHSERRR